MPLPDPKPPRSAPLTPAERQAILDAVTSGSRSQRSVGDDPTIRGTHDQVRAVVRDAICDDPSLPERFPKLIRRTAPEISSMEVVAADEGATEQTTAEALAAAGVPVETARFHRAVTTSRWRIHFVRNPDGTFAAVRAKHVEARVEWVATEAAAALSPTMEIPAHLLPATSSVPPRTLVRRLPPILAAGLVVLLLAIGAALFRQVDEGMAAQMVDAGHIDGGGR
jgi:hypothetical protein